MKIVVFHQPFPMGNYKICTTIGQKLSEMGHEVYSLQQLNGVKPDNDYVQQILDLKPDLIYNEMLDVETFKILEKLDCRKILTYCSKGILPKWDSIIDYHESWFTDIMTNSKPMSKIFEENNIPVTRFEFLPNVIAEEEIEFKNYYNHDCVFLGMGFTRLNSLDYEIERNLFFNDLGDTDFKIYGNGWPNGGKYAGILPANDIGRLYGSAKTGVAIIGKGQREHGMINNRYCEMGFCQLPIITYNYNLDWFGLDKYLFFTESAVDTQKLVKQIIKDKSDYKDRLNEMKNFISDKTDIFFEKLGELLK